MEIFVSDKEILENCSNCINYDNYKCKLNKNVKFLTEVPKNKNSNCPFKSLEQHDKELLQEFADKLYNDLNTLTKHGYTDDQWEEICISKGDVEDLIKKLLKERGVE